MVVIESLTKSEEDMISELPDALICEILCRISTKDVVKTSVLSKRWKNIWQQIPLLDLDSEQFETLSGFLSFANSVFDLQRGLVIRKLSLYMSRWGHDDYNSFLNQWTDDSPTMRNIQHLDIRSNALSRITVLPLSIYTCKTVVQLQLSWVTLARTEFVSLPCLKILHLQQVMYHDKATMEKLISNPPLLEDLTLICLSPPRYDERFLHVQSQTLKKIEINSSIKVDIDAPLLQCLRANVNKHKKFKIINSGFSVKADISFCGLYDHGLIHDVLTDVLWVRELVISSNTWKVFIEYLNPSLQFCYLSHLHFHLLDTYSGMLPTFLESCPKLESLILELLVGVACTKVVVSTVPSCLVSSLKFVEFRRPITGYETEMKLVKYFLKNSTILKKLTLRVSNYRMTKGKDAILGEIFATPKVSIDCEILVL